MTESASGPASSVPSSEATCGLLVEIDGPLVTLTLNRPDRRNALSESMLSELEAALTKLIEESQAAGDGPRVVVIAATGKVFSSGHDLTEMRNRAEADYQSLFGRCSRVMQMIRRLPIPVIARVQGLATAAGCQLVAACDLVVAAEEAAFAAPGVKIGLFCATPMVPLVRAIPAKPAMEMLLTGDAISAARAYELGLVNRVVSAADLDAAVAEYAEKIAATSREVIALGKRAFYEQLNLGEGEAYSQATDIIAKNATMPAAQEGIAAFLEKRPPQWPA